MSFTFIWNFNIFNINFLFFLIISQILEYFQYIPNLLYSDRININNSYTFLVNVQAKKSFVARKFIEVKSYFRSQPGFCEQCLIPRPYESFHPICIDIYQIYLEQFPIGTDERLLAQIFSLSKLFNFSTCRSYYKRRA